MTLAAFLSIWLIHLAAAISPGPSFVICARTAASEGFGVAVAMSFGFGLGAILWAWAAMAGLALVFQLLPELLSALKIIGGAVLLYIAFRMWRHAAEPLALPAEGAAPRSAVSAFRLGLLTFASNPKPALFFGAVFVGLVPADTPLTWRFAILLVVFANEVGWYIVVSRLFSLPRARLAYLRLKPVMDRLFGGVLAALGLKIALT